MRHRTAEVLLRLYPRAWRDRFGPEFTALLTAEPLGWRVAFDLVRAALAERVLNVSGLEDRMAYASSIVALARRPSGFAPLLMSAAALATVLLAMTVGGAAGARDEGAAAHLFQLLIAGQLPLLAFFALRWVRSTARAALSVLAIQALALGVAMLPVWLLRL